MSNNKWFDSILSIFSSKEVKIEGCYSCAKGFDCPEHKVSALAKGVDPTKLVTPGLKQMAADIAQAQKVLDNDKKELAQAEAELTRKSNILQWQEELYMTSVKLVDDIAETRVKTAAKEDAIKAKNLAVKANDQALASWATISLEDRIANATARLQKAAPTVSASQTPAAAPSQPKSNPPKGEDATKAIAALVALGLTEGQASSVCKLSSAKDVAAQVERWVKSGKAQGAAAIAKALVGVGHRKGLWAKYVSVKAPTKAPAPAGPASPDQGEVETQTTTTTTAKRRNPDGVSTASSGVVGTEIPDPDFSAPDVPSKEAGQRLRGGKPTSSVPSGVDAFEDDGVDFVGV